MRTRKLFFLLITLMAFTVSSQAQVSVNVNLGKPPVWAPAAPVNTKYYYIPDIETYYDVSAQRYIYLRNGRWHRSAALPAHYRGYDLYKGKTVFLTDYRGNRPYAYYKTHKVKYKGNGNWKNKAYNKNAPGKGNGKYKGHPGKGNGNGKGKGKH
ncbi:hypothetical protein [Flavobacterium sp.]|uniref:hypothetical protein n=1 Tax=Flavobacterium sp. TaxID=239 RepID=UPI00391B8D9D